MTWYQARFPDKGSGASRMTVYVEGKSEDEIRSRLSDHPRLNMYDTSSGKLTKISDSREGIEARILDVANPNEAITKDNTVLIRNIEDKTITKKTY